MRKEYDNIEAQNKEKDEEIKRMFDKLQEQEAIIQQCDEKTTNTNYKCEKTIRRLEKIVNQVYYYFFLNILAYDNWFLSYEKKMKKYSQVMST